MKWAHRVGVGFAVDGNGLDAKLLAGAHDAQGNLATVGDEHLLDLRRPS